ncbi:MAG: bifunctional adenosylcobinamide kinase/adenosylcobinamide-phosphate guanylyltransferase [Spirochaetaceae bacterium]|nr:bifunctional adenosylcobinamide kinase/adenosylcobinamide-phosphate guanylyltransferase [Spirochaetaceae bacterium]
MSNITLVIGGSRSGKSRYSEEISRSLVENPKKRYYIATAEAFDVEMQDRIKHHKEKRADTFITIEEPIKLSEAIEAIADKASIILVDCLTVWLGNLMYYNKREELTKLYDTLKELKIPVVMVSNETSWEVIPDNNEAREFINLSQNMNKNIATFADNLILCISGIPIAIKGELQ